MERGSTSAFSPGQRYSLMVPLFETPPVATYSIIETPGEGKRQSRRVPHKATVVRTIGGEERGNKDKENVIDKESTHEHKANLERGQSEGS